MPRESTIPRVLFSLGTLVSTYNPFWAMSNLIYLHITSLSRLHKYGNNDIHPRSLRYRPQGHNKCLGQPRVICQDQGPTLQ